MHAEAPDSRYLADLAPILTNPERVERLTACDSTDCIAATFRRGRESA
jgi:hypothetical protein